MTAEKNEGGPGSVGPPSRCGACKGLDAFLAGYPKIRESRRIPGGFRKTRLQLRRTSRGTSPNTRVRPKSRSEMKLEAGSGSTRISRSIVHWGRATNPGKSPPVHERIESQPPEFSLYLKQGPCQELPMQSLVYQEPPNLSRHACGSLLPNWVFLLRHPRFRLHGPTRGLPPSCGQGIVYLPALVAAKTLFYARKGWIDPHSGKTKGPNDGRFFGSGNRVRDKFDLEENGK